MSIEQVAGRLYEHWARCNRNMDNREELKKGILNGRVAESRAHNALRDDGCNRSATRVIA